LQPGDPAYPAEWLKAAGHANGLVTARGNVDLLAGHQFVALFCSVRCPGDLILKTYDLARALRDAGVPVIGGFHSPMEKECLRLLLRGRQPVVVCPARGIENMRVPAEWRPPLAEGRLLLLSPFSSSQRRPTADQAALRNDFVAALAHRVFVAHAAPGGKTEAFARKVLDWGKPLLTLEGRHNQNLVALGARAVVAEDVR
ncbi:MAG: DNA-processing protein DprA, partial [Chloroflexota bacterium]|nr:DNA-processing protein DprA [Chloroflexota bacterium]